MKPITLSDHKQKISYLSGVIGQTLRDHRVIASEGGNIFYNLDFGLICPLLFNHPSEGSNDFLEPVTQWMKHVLNVASNNEDLRFIMSAATLYEFYDQMNHFLESLKQSKPALLENYFRKRIDDDSGITTDEIRKNLSIFSEQGYNENVLQPVNRLLRYLDDGIIYGVGDYFDSLTPTEVGMFNTLTESFLEQHRVKRLSAPTNKRSFNDSMFHFRMDCINNALSLVLAKRKGHTPLFVTPTALNLQQCIAGESNFGRYDRVPLFYLNLGLLELKNHFPDAEDFLSDGFRVATNLCKELEGYDSMEKVPFYLREKMEAFYRMYAAPLASHRIFDESPNGDVREEITKVLSSRQRMSEIIDHAVEDIQLAAIELEQYSERIDTSYMDNPETLQDPILKKLKKISAWSKCYGISCRWSIHS